MLTFLKSIAAQYSPAYLAEQAQWLSSALTTGMPENVKVIPGIPPTYQFDMSPRSRSMIVPCDIWLLRSLSPEQRLAKVNDMVAKGYSMCSTEPSDPAYHITWNGIKAMMDELYHGERIWYTWFMYDSPSDRAHKAALFAFVLEMQMVHTPVVQDNTAPTDQYHREEERITLPRDSPRSAVNATQQQAMPTPKLAPAARQCHGDDEIIVVSSRSLTPAKSLVAKGSEEVIVIPSRSPSPVSQHNTEQVEGLAPTADSPEIAETSDVSRKRKATNEVDKEAARKKSRIEERKAVLTAKAKADAEEYENNAQAIEAYYIRTNMSRTRKASDPTWQKLEVWRQRYIPRQPTLGLVAPVVQRTATGGKEGARKKTAKKSMKESTPVADKAAPKKSQKKPRKAVRSRRGSHSAVLGKMSWSNVPLHKAFC
jgi:hypothetical protein